MCKIHHWLLWLRVKKPVTKTDVVLQVTPPWRRVVFLPIKQCKLADLAGFISPEK